MSNIHAAPIKSSLGRMFDSDPAAGAVASMDPGYLASDSGAPAAHVTPASVDPITKDNLSTKGKMFTWRNPVAGQGTFVQQDDSGATSLPNSMGA